MMCWNATVNCPDTDSINAVFGYKVPPGPSGTIVLFSGGPGLSPSEYADNNSSYAQDYYAAGYAVVLLEWDSPWEKAYADNTNESILTAACRPATLLNYISNTFLSADTPSCAQGSSAGSAAIAYAMSWYGASYLKNVELLSGPVLSQIDTGCSANPPTPTICGQGDNSYCTQGTQTAFPSGWTDNAGYVTDDQNFINNWTGTGINNHPGCGTPGVTEQEIAAWAGMSIVDGSDPGYTGVFSFPQGLTKHGWLCASYSTCGGNDCPNSSAAQGYYWYDKLSKTGDPSLVLTGTESCAGPEGVSEGTDPDTGVPPESNQIESDMEAHCKSSN